MYHPGNLRMQKPRRKQCRNRCNWFDSSLSVEGSGHSGKPASMVLGGNVGSATTQQAHDEFTCIGITDLDEH